MLIVDFIKKVKEIVVNWFGLELGNHTQTYLIDALVRLKCYHIFLKFDINLKYSNALLGSQV